MYIIFYQSIQQGSVYFFQCVQWELLAVVCTLAWLNLLGDVRQLPYLGIYVIMFFDILKTFLQFVVVFLIFIIAFALGKTKTPSIIFF